MQEVILKELHDGDFYHICTEGLEQTILLKDDEDYMVAWNYLALSAWRTDVQIVAFVLMSNHFHILVACSGRMLAQRYIKLFKQLLSTYLRIKYKSSKIMHCSDDSITLIDSIQYLRNCIAYILRNPVSARLCKRPDEYRWSSYRFRDSSTKDSGRKVSKLGFTLKRSLLRTGMDLSGCRFLIDDNGYITLDSFVDGHLITKAFRYSGKSFLYHLGCCNDTMMEYELVYKPLMTVTDGDMYDLTLRHVAKRFPAKSISELTTSEKCSIVKHLYFSNKTNVPQLSRILGIPRDLIKKILSQ